MRNLSTTLDGRGRPRKHLIVLRALSRSPKCQRIKLSDIFKKNVTYYEDPNKELFEIWEKEKSEGILYFNFKGKYYTETQMDSIADVITKQIIEEMIKELDSTHLKN